MSSRQCIQFNLLISNWYNNQKNIQNIQLQKIIRSFQRDRTLWEEVVGNAPFETAYLPNGEKVAISNMLPEIIPIGID